MFPLNVSRTVLSIVTSGRCWQCSSVLTDGDDSYLKNLHHHPPSITLIWILFRWICSIITAFNIGEILVALLLCWKPMVWKYHARLHLAVAFHFTRRAANSNHTRVVTFSRSVLICHHPFRFCQTIACTTCYWYCHSSMTYYSITPLFSINK